MFQISLNDIEYIVAISNELSLTAAAERLGVTTSAVTQRLDRMEEAVGHKLVNRRRASLTEAGHRVLKFGHSLLNDYEQMHLDLLDLGRPRLRIMANASLMIDDLVMVVERMKINDQKIEIELAEGNFPEIINAVLNGHFDLGLIAGRPKVKGLRLFPYKTERLCIITQTSHPLAKAKEATFSEAATYPMIGTDRKKQISILLNAKAKKLNLRLKQPLRISSLEAQVYSVCKSDVGIAIVLESMARRFASQFPIQIIRLNETWAEHKFSICVRETGSLSETARDFVQLLIQLKK